MLPRAGGPYVYLKEAYGPLPAFLFGWTELLVIRTGSMAALAAAFSRYFSQLVGPPAGMRIEVWQGSVAMLAIAALAIVNIRGTKLGGGVQLVGTIVKVAALAAMIALPFVLGVADPQKLQPIWPKSFSPLLLDGFLAAMVSVLWAYDGWVSLTPLAEEVKEPSKNLPRALILGSILLIVIYVGMTLAYHLTLPLDRIAGDASLPAEQRLPVAADFCRTLLGPKGAIAIACVVMASTFISLNGNALAGPRAYFAMARDGLFFRRLGVIHPKFQTPAASIVVQCGWAILLTLLTTILIVAPAPNSGLPGFALEAWRTAHEKPLYDIMYTYVIFGATVFYALDVAAVFVLRAKIPGAKGHTRPLDIH